MAWQDMAACFFGGVFFANGIPHLVAGVSGRWFPSPFAKPPFRGLSHPVVNVLWGLFNHAAAYVLLVLLGGVELRAVPRVAVAAAGFALAAVGIARSLGKASGGAPAGGRPPE